MIKLSDELHIPTMREILAERDREAARSARPVSRHFNAAKVNRQNADWTTQPYSANWLNYRSLRTLRARAREMCANAPHFKKVLMLAETNVIGPQGIQLQCRAEIGDRLHSSLNKRVELAFWQWGFAENCSVTGKFDWIGQQKHVVKTLIRDGEALIRMYSSGPYGCQLKFINVDYLDETYNDTLPGGNRVIMSVEIDADDRPVAYWLTTPASDINFTQKRERTRTRVPAEQIIHGVLNLDDESQVRGVTWFHAVLLEGKNLESYKHGVITQARMSANIVGFIEEDNPEDGGGYDGAEDGEGRRILPEISVAPLSMNRLPPGMKFSQMDPKQPTQNHPQFKQTLTGDVATGVGLNYFELQGDMASVNYSSARVGLGETRDLWRGLQNLIISSFCRPVFHAWLSAAMLSGKLQISMSDYEKVQNPEWRARGWRYVDPQKEIGAQVVGLQNNLMTLTDQLAEQGIDVEDHFKTIQKERELAMQYGIDLTIQTKTSVSLKPEPDEDDAEKPADKSRGYSNGSVEILN